MNRPSIPNHSVVNPIGTSATSSTPSAVGATLLATILTVFLVAVILIVPTLGGVSRLWEARGATPAINYEEAEKQVATYLGTAEISAAPERSGIYSHVPVGGISGLDCDRSGCLAISDDPGLRGPVRAYPLDPDSGRVGDPIVLTDGSGRPYPAGLIDPESIRLADDAIVWTGEGTPRVTIANRTGRAQESWEVDIPGADIRVNQGLEGLAVDNCGDGRRIITATEASPTGMNHPVITEFRRGTTATTSVTSYFWPGTGVSDILAVGDGSLLVLERGYTPGMGNSAAIYRTRLEGTGAHPVLRRQLIMDAAAMLGADQIGNAEAMAWGEPHQEGDKLVRTLLLATDDNFSSDQRGVLHKFILKIG